MTQQERIVHFYAQAEQFIRILVGLAANRGINTWSMGLFMDHICYRVETEEAYHTMGVFLGEVGELLDEPVIVGGRPIANFKLKEPITIPGVLVQPVYVVELPAPKDGSFYPKGFEHAEFVIDDDFPAFMRRFPDIDWDTRGMQKASNPDIKMVLANGKVIKFHREALKRVIQRERDGRIFSQML